MAGDQLVSTRKQIRRIRAVVRPEVLQGLLSALQEKGVPRAFVRDVRSVGAGVDPENYRISAEGGESYSGRKIVEFYCDPDAEAELTDLIRDTARTGHRGDGIIATSGVDDLINIRTGDRGLLALV